MVLTEHPRTRRRNLGLYRLQLFSKDATGMHWQSMKGGRGHYWEAEQEGKNLEVAVVIRAHPPLIIAALLPLPGGVGENGFARVFCGESGAVILGEKNDIIV